MKIWKRMEVMIVFVRKGTSKLVLISARNVKKGVFPVIIHLNVQDLVVRKGISLIRLILFVRNVQI